MTLPPDQTRTRRTSGPAPRLSQARIVAGALDLLRTDGLAGLTMAKLARRIGASTMSLYTYFPSRDALLDAVADDIFAQFALPPDPRDWERALIDWCDALRLLFDRHPIAARLIKWDDHLSPAWLRTWLPMVKILQAEGLSGPRLAFACRWFSRAVMGMLATRSSATAAAPFADALAATGLAAGDAALLARLVGDAAAIDEADTFRFDVAVLLNGMRGLIADAAVAVSPSRRDRAAAPAAAPRPGRSSSPPPAAPAASSTGPS